MMINSMLIDAMNRTQLSSLLTSYDRSHHMRRWRGSIHIKKSNRSLERGRINCQEEGSSNSALTSGNTFF